MLPRIIATTTVSGPRISRGYALLGLVPHDLGRVHPRRRVVDRVRDGRGPVRRGRAGPAVRVAESGAAVAVGPLELGHDGVPPRPVIRIVEHDLKRAMEAGYVRECDAHVAATLVVGGVEKLGLAALRSSAPVDLDALAREATTLHSIGLMSDRLKTG